jgi:serine/threonine-protein kinase
MNIGRYQVESRLGEGPRGVVYKGYDAESSRQRGHATPLVIKVLYAHLCTNPRLEKQCLELLQTLRQVECDLISRMITAGTLPDGRVYLVSEYVAGQTLLSRLRDGGALTPLTALHVAGSVAIALAAAQKHGLHHLSLRPANILLIRDAAAPGGERVKLLDLGLARLLPVRESSDASSVSYLAPEQIEQTTTPDGQADVYALGNLLYEMLTGRPRRTGERGHIKSIPPAPPTSIKQLFPVISREMTALLQSMRSRDPEQRPLMSQVAHRLAQLEEDMLIGETIGHYRVKSRLAMGGMSTIFRAIHEHIGREAAIKVMRSQFIHNADVRRRFLNEARVVNRVRHPGLVEIYEYGELASERPYLVMELLEGESLHARRQRRGGSLPEGQAVSVVHQVAQAVLALHERGVVHLDLKPENVMIVPDPYAQGGERIKLIDFGMAQIVEASEDIDETGRYTRTGESGTPTYMAPEQFGGLSAVSEKTDVFALGVMLYELLGGKRPYEQVGFAPMSEPHQPLGQAAPHVSEGTCALADRMLAFRPAERPSLKEVIAALSRLPDPEPQPLPAPPEAAHPDAETAAPAEPSPSAVTQPMRAQPEPASEALPAAQKRPPPLLYAGTVAAVLLIAGAGLLIAGTAPRRPAVVERQQAELRPAAPESSPAPPPQPAARQKEPDLGTLRERALAVLREGLTDRDPAVRRHAAATLGRLRNLKTAELRPLLGALLADREPAVQAEAATALARLGEQGQRGAILQLVARTRDPHTFVAAANALDLLDAAEGRRRLREALESRDLGVRLHAAVLLAERGDREAEGQLRRLLVAPNLPELLRLQALGRLALDGDMLARRQLQQRLEPAGGATEARITAAQQLTRLGDERGRTLLLRWAQEPGPQQLRTAWALAELAEGRGCSIFDLGPPLEAPAPHLVLAAALSACGKPEDAPPLASLMLSGGPDLPRQQRQTAAAALLMLASLAPRGK